MAYLLVWKKAHPGYPNSGASFRPIVAYSQTDTFTAQEHSTFQVVERADLSLSDMRGYCGLDANNLNGGLMCMAPQDSPVRRIVNGEEVRWTQAEMDART